MVWDFLKDDIEPRLPARRRVVLTMGFVGILTGLVSSLPLPIPEIRLEEDGLILNTPGSPLHAGVAFAVGIALCMWAWVSRDLGKCLLTAILILIGWLAAVNTANDLYQFLVGSAAFGTAYRRQGEQGGVGTHTWRRGCWRGRRRSDRIRCGDFRQGDTSASTLESDCAYGCAGRSHVVPRCRDALALSDVCSLASHGGRLDRCWSDAKTLVLRLYLVST